MMMSVVDAVGCEDCGDTGEDRTLETKMMMTITMTMIDDFAGEG